MSQLTVAEIELVLRGYAAGDAFGVAYEFESDIGEVDPNVLRAKDAWPYGGVSDDTLLTLMTINSVTPESAEESKENFIKRLRAAIPQLRGLGPTTRSALGLPVKDSELEQIGISNGALMRTSLLGLAFHPEEVNERRFFVRSLASATHQSEVAIGCALIGSALFSDSAAYGELHSPFETAERELLGIDLEISLQDWREPICTGISNESTETLNAVLWTLKSSRTAREALQVSCELGGDTDTVAALTTSLLIARKRDSSDFLSIPWLSSLQWEEISEITHTATYLHQLFNQRKGISG